MNLTKKATDTLIEMSWLFNGTDAESVAAYDAITNVLETRMAKADYTALIESQMEAATSCDKEWKSRCRSAKADAPFFFAADVYCQMEIVR